MGLVMKRKKKWSLMASLFYRLSDMLFFIKPETKLKFCLDINRCSEWLAFKEIIRKDNIRIIGLDFLRNHIKKDARILDLGCGGYNSITKGLWDITTNITGVDLSKNSLERVRKENKVGRYIYGNILDYVDKVKSGEFDTVILCQVIEHLENLKKFIKTISKKVKTMYIEVPDFEASHLNMYRVSLDLTLNNTDPDHIYEFDRTELKTLLEECGFEVVDEEYRFGMIRVFCRSNVT